MSFSGQLQGVTHLVESCAVFSSLSPRHLLELESRDALRTFTLNDGESITLSGASDHEAVFVIKGSALCRVNGDANTTTRLAADSCKPIALPPGGAVELTASGPATLCRTDRDQIDYLICWNALMDNLGPEQSDLRAQLASLNNPAVFMRLPFANVEAAFERMTSVSVSAGDEVIRQGEAGDRFYIIEEGVAEVWRRGLYDDDQSQVAELRVGDHFGDEALLVGGTRNATVRMASDGRLLVLDKADFQELIGNPLVEEVDASVAKALIEDGYEVVDVRYEEEFEDGHLANVTLIPLPELRSRLKELSPKKKFLTYCLSGKRSAVAAMIMQQHGLKTVCLKDGLREWPYELEAGMA